MLKNIRCIVIAITKNKKSAVKGTSESGVTKILLFIRLGMLTVLVGKFEASGFQPIFAQ